MTTGAHGNRPTKNQRREEARAKARSLRESQVKKDKTRKILTQVGVIVGVLAIVAVIFVAIQGNLPKPGPRPANMASNGIVLTAELGKDGKPTGKIVAETNSALPEGAAPVPTTPKAGVLNIVIYQDYMCPVCANFDGSDSSVIESRVKSGAATYEIHPVAILDPQSQGTKYSTRAANAAACVANSSPNSFWTFNQLLFTNHPAEGSAGLSDDDLIKYAVLAEANAADVTPCIKNQTFSPWATSATDLVMAKGAILPNSDNVTFSGTPTVIVNGTQYDFTKRPNSQTTDGRFAPADFEAFLLEQAGKMVK
jgi:protein-disulfide isomerase